MLFHVQLLEVRRQHIQSSSILYQVSDEPSFHQLVSPPITSHQTIIAPSSSSIPSTSLQTTSHMTYEMGIKTEQDSMLLACAKDLKSL